MTKKNILIFVLVLLLGGLSFYLNRNRFGSEPLHISHRSMPPRGERAGGRSAAAPVFFLFNKGFKPKSIKVFVVSDAETNKYPHAIWNLVPDSKPVAISQFIYGDRVSGMRPAVEGVGPEPLVPGVPYRLVVEGGSEKAEHDFTPDARIQ